MMTMRTAKVDGFKFAVNGVKVTETVKGKSYDIPDDLYGVWEKGGKFEKGEVKVKPPTVKKSMPESEENK